MTSVQLSQCLARGGAAGAQGEAQASGGRALTSREYCGAGEAKAEGVPGGRAIAAARLLEELLAGGQGEGAEGGGVGKDTAATNELEVTCKKSLSLQLSSS